MIHAADIREWRTHDVVDPKGHKIGVLEAVYVDTTTDEPAVVTVRTGLPTRRRLVFVPLDARFSADFGYLLAGGVSDSPRSAQLHQQHLAEADVRRELGRNVIRSPSESRSDSHPRRGPTRWERVCPGGTRRAGYECSARPKRALTLSRPGNLT